jgi:hypothetical protein
LHRENAGYSGQWQESRRWCGMPKEKCPLTIEDCDGYRSRVEARPEILPSHSIRYCNQSERVVASRSGKELCTRGMRNGESK